MKNARVVLIALSMILLIAAASSAQSRCQSKRGAVGISPAVPSASGAKVQQFATEAAGGYTLICPAGCTKVTGPPNHHGETKTFCDCDGDGKFDGGVCQIWLRNSSSVQIDPVDKMLGERDFDPRQLALAAGGSTPICAPGCPGTQQCSMVTVQKPDGTTIKFCQCV